MDEVHVAVVLYLTGAAIEDKELQDYAADMFCNMINLNLQAIFSR
jgi:hypothetical protein